MRQTLFYKALSAILVITLSSHLFSQDIPGWVTNTPDDDEHYYARVDVKTIEMSEQQYKAEANEQALLEISMQIRATVSGTVEMSVTEIDDNITETFGMESYTSTMADIEGAKKVDDYQMAGKYWVLWKLNKAKHKENIERHAENAKGYYRTFLRMPKDDPVVRLEQLIPAYEYIVKVVGQQVIYEENDRIVNLGTEIPNQISRLLNELRLSATGKTRFTMQSGIATAKPLKVTVKSSDTELLGNIPIEFTFESGEGEFSNNVAVTSENGNAKTEISRIFSRERVQRVRAKIDLKQLREDRMTRFVSFEQHLDKVSTKNSVLYTLDVAQVTQEKIAVITVGDTVFFNEDMLKRLNRIFRQEFSDVTEFKLKDEALIEGIIEDYKRSASLCSNEECQIQIGNKLGVEQLIFVDVANYPTVTSITIYLRNIAEKELVLEHGYDFKHKQWGSEKPEKPAGYNNALSRLRTAERDLEKAQKKQDKIDSQRQENQDSEETKEPVENLYQVATDEYERVKKETSKILGKYNDALQKYENKLASFKDDQINDIRDNISFMVEDFWLRRNPGHLTMNCLARGVRGSFTFADPTQWMEKDFERRLPMVGEKFYEGTYELDINKLGYEKFHMRFEVAMGDYPEFDVDLKAKRPGKALFKSLLIPGRGQIYSSDQDHRSRFVMGTAYFVTTMALASGSGYLWSEYFAAKDVYETTQVDYQNAVDIADIESTQSIMSDKHIIMSDKHSTAVLVTGITAGLWLYNTIDAFLFFPAEYKVKRFSLRAGPQFLAGKPGAKTKLSWNF